MNDKTDTIARGVRLWAVKNITALVIMVGLLFASAGRLNWIWGWIMLGAYLVLVGCMAWLLGRKHPDLIAERSKLQKGTKKWDTGLAFLAATGIPIATLVVAGLDARFGWSHSLPTVARLAMLIPMALGQGFFIWAMVANKFFSATVRIQEDRNHSVATGGPYRYVRHPGYVGSIVWQLCIPLMLGSWWALIPAGLVVPVLGLRTALEDRTLQEELAGYKEYARQVRYRLLPGIW